MCAMGKGGSPTLFYGPSRQGLEKRKGMEMGNGYGRPRWRRRPERGGHHEPLQWVGQMGEELTVLYLIRCIAGYRPGLD